MGQGTGSRSKTGHKANYMYQCEIETLPRQQLKKLQLERLTNTLQYAYEKVPFYKRQFDEAGLEPGKLRHVEDISKYPFTVKSNLRDHYPFGMIAVPRQNLMRIQASSGTTGKPTVVGYNAADIHTWSTLMARTLACAGARPKDIIQNAFGYGLFTGGLGVHYGAEKLGCTVVPISGGQTERQLLLMRDIASDVICATPSFALHMAERARNSGIDIGDYPLRVGFFGAEPWTEGIRAELEDRLGIIACDNYGLSEIIGPGVATECAEAQNGLHGWEDHFLFEVVDPESGIVLPPGEKGELVITTLTKQALPMIRYRTRDITHLIEESCSCGRSHLRLAKMTGRTDDMLIIRGVNVFPSQIEICLLALEGLTSFFHLVVTRVGSMDSLTVEVEASRDLNRERYEQVSAAAKSRIKSLVGISCDVEIKGPGQMPRTEGKSLRVLDHRN